MSSSDSNYHKALKDDESVKEFLATVAKFDREFCDCLADGIDFTIRIEVHGDKGKLIHARLFSDSFRRPRNAKPAKPIKSLS